METFGAFLSYTRIDDKHDRGFLTRLRNRLSGEVRVQTGKEFPIFQDRFGIRWGEDWDERIGEALAASDFLIPILTPSFFGSEGCRQELRRFIEIEQSRNRNDLILPLYYIKTPMIESKEQTERDELARLLVSRQLQDWTMLRDVPARILNPKVRNLAYEIVERLQRGASTSGVAQHRDHKGPAPPLRMSTFAIINRPPELVPKVFLDRQNTFDALVERLQHRSRGIAVLVGDVGSGKTAFIAEFLDRLERNRLPLELDSFDYIATRGYRPMNAATIIGDLAKAHPDNAVRSRLGERIDGNGASWLNKLDLVLTELGRRRVLVVIDNAEGLLDADGRVGDRVLRDMFHGLAEHRTDHRVQLLLVTTVSPDLSLRGYSPSDAVVFGRGLPESEILDFMLGRDPRQPSPFTSASPEQFTLVHTLTEGRPRSLELMLSVLASERSDGLMELLEAIRSVPIETRPRVLLDRTLDGLPRPDIRVVRAVAIFGRPVPAAAVGRLLGHDCGEALARLSVRRLLRRDGDRYYLPPDEACYVVRQLERGEPGDRKRHATPQTQIALFHHAANYFADEAARTTVQRVEDLSPHFGEIDLRIRGGEFDRAFQLMTALNERYLEGSGHSDALSEFRERVVGTLGTAHDELRNLSEIANAKSQQENHDAAINALYRARERNADVARESTRESNERDLLLMVAGVHFDDGQMTQAHKDYEQALRLHPRRSDSVREAQAHSGASLCLMEIGRFQTAARHQDISLALIKHDTSLEAKRLRAQLLLNQGIRYLYKGESHIAIGHLDSARSLAKSIGDLRLEARCIDALALTKLDLNDTKSALPLATEASETGALSGSPELSRNAHSTLALVHLHIGNTSAALAAANAAAEFGQSRRGWGAFAIRGIAFLREREPEHAKADFFRAHSNATAMLKKEKYNFQILEFDGLALAGLIVCRLDHYLPDAESAYRRARQRTRANGAVRLCMQKLNALLAECDDAAYASVRAAAEGRPSTPG